VSSVDRQPTVEPIFPRWANRAPLAVGVGGPLALVALVLGVWYWFSPKYTDVGYAPRQPLSFSHKLHAGDLGLDCRYCHNTVERAAYAAIPPTATCINCHHVVLKNSPTLEPLRTAHEANRPLRWVNVHLLPGYAYFDHSAHLAAGVGCATCHGRIDQMPVVRQVQPLSMSWCLGCHRDPTPQLRPRDEITNMKWDRAEAGYDPADDPGRRRALEPPTHCSGCHR